MSTTTTPRTIKRTERRVHPTTGYAVRVDVELRPCPGTEREDGVSVDAYELSICGTYREGGGQCIDACAELFPEIIDTWKRWHLNGMRAGCSHQRVDDPMEEELTLYTYRLNSATSAAQRALRKRGETDIRTLGIATATDDERRLLNLPYEVVNDGDAENGIDPTEYSLEKTEKKRAGWVKPTEHPRGMLCVPCTECGYQYGSKWLFEALPPEVIEWARNFGAPA